MANNPSAIKRHRQSLKRRARNRAEMSRLRGSIKKVRTAIEENDGEAALELLAPTLQMIDVSVKKNVLHRNAAGRYKSRLTRQVIALQR